MKLLLISSACVCLLIYTFQSHESAGWKGLVPLHATRSDVERLLGPSEEKCKCFYNTREAKIFVEYSQGPCKGFLAGWRVPADVVLMITVQPNAEVRFSDLSLDLTRFVTTSGTDTPRLYTDNDSGVRYSVRETGIVESISYIPRRADFPIRCEGFPSSPDLGHREFNPFDTYSNIRFVDERARLDNFSIWLRQQPEMKGYILFYASRDFSSKRAKRRAQRASDYLIRVRHLDAQKVQTIDGGYRDQFQIELYILPASIGPPASRPTVPRTGAPEPRR